QRFGGLLRLVLIDRSTDHLAGPFGQLLRLVGGDLPRLGLGQVIAGGMRQIAGPGLLTVGPQRKERGSGGVGPFLDRDDRSQLRNPHAVLGNRFGVAYAGVPPTGASDALQHSEFETEGGECCGVIWHVVSSLAMVKYRGAVVRVPVDLAVLEAT